MSAENGSNTPDFILAAYLSACLAAFNASVNERETWYGRALAAPKGSSLVDRVNAARQEMQSWSDERRENVRLEGDGKGAADD